MGIQINGQTDNISAVDGSLSVDGITDLTVSGNLQTSSINGGPISGARNRIINGDMRIDQRNNGVSVTPISDGATYPVDRWVARLSQTSKYSAQRNTSIVPPGFNYSLAITSLSAYSVGSLDYFAVEHRVEGFNMSDLAWGTSSAKSVTLSFWVRSSLTGTFGGSIINGSPFDRSYPFTYTISAANTWEYKTVAIAGPTSGTWDSTNGLGLSVFLAFGTGSSYSGTAGSWVDSTYLSATGATSVVGTNGATFYITGVQLEAGTVATPFERRSFGQELALCQRYYVAEVLPYIRYGRDVASGRPSTVWVDFPVTMRAAPTTTQSTAGGVGSQFVNVATRTLTIAAAAAGNDMAALQSYTANAEL